MAEKKTLYELLGLSNKASSDDIQRAFLSLRTALESEPESEEKHNRLAILQDARDVLQDRRRRSGYDHRQRGLRQIEASTPTPAPVRSPWTALALLLILGAVYLAWTHTPAEISNPKTPVTPVPALPPVKLAEPTDISKDIAVLLPPLPAGEKSPPAVPEQKGLPRPVSEAPHAATLMKIADSTFAIVGGAALGTAVAIGRDKLLTNCHVIAPNVLKGPMYAVSAITGAKTLITEAAFLITEDACLVHAPGLNGKPVAFGDAGQLPKETPIFNIGFVNGRLIFSAGVLLGIIRRDNQTYLVSSNQCDQGVSGGPLVDVDGRLVGLTSGGPADRSFCLSITAETARKVLAQTLIGIDAFPPNYLSNLARHW